MPARIPLAILAIITTALLLGTPIVASSIQDAPRGEKAQDENRSRRGAGQTQANRQAAPARVIARMMQSDTDGDGRLSREEVGDGRFAGMFVQVDTDKDGYIDEKEISVFLASGQPGTPPRGSRPTDGAEEEQAPVDGRAKFDEGMAEAGRALRDLRRTPLDKTSFTRDLQGTMRLQEGLFMARNWISKVSMSDAAKEKFGSDEQAYLRSFQLHMAQSMRTSFQLEIAILEGDSDKAKALVKTMVAERNSGHELF